MKKTFSVVAVLAAVGALGHAAWLFALQPPGQQTGAADVFERRGQQPVEVPVPANTFRPDSRVAEEPMITGPNAPAVSRYSTGTAAAPAGSLQPAVAPQNDYYNYSTPRDSYATPPVDDARIVELNAKDIQLEQQVRQTVASMRAATTDAERESQMGILKKLLTEQFDIRHARREREIELVEARVQKLRQGLQKRANAKDRIVETRYSQLVEDLDGLGWGSPADDQASGYRFYPMLGIGPDGPAVFQDSYGRPGRAAILPPVPQYAPQQVSPPSTGAPPVPAVPLLPPATGAPPVPAVPRVLPPATGAPPVLTEPSRPLQDNIPGRSEVPDSSRIPAPPAPPSRR